MIPEDFRLPKGEESRRYQGASIFDPIIIINLKEEYGDDFKSDITEHY